MRFEPLHPAIGASVTGVDLRRPLSDADLDAVKDERYDRLPLVEHPLVRVHPVTGRSSLFISPHTMERVVGMGEARSRELFEALVRHATQPAFVYRHRWRAHDVLMWDDRCTMHAVMPYDSARTRRIMHRTTVVGNGPVMPAREGDPDEAL